MELLESPPSMEKRKDPKDGLSYTKEQFFKYYGVQEGQTMRDVAIPDKDEVEIACEQSLMEINEVENQMVSEATLRSRQESECWRILVLGYNKHPIEFTDAIWQSELAKSLRNRGVDISPQWANGARILIEGLTPAMLEKSGFAPGDLRRSHVVVTAENEDNVEVALRQSLSYRTRPRIKTRTVITCWEPVMRAIFGPEEDSSTSFPKDLCITRTFLDVPKNIRVGWDPRSVYTKSSNDRHGIENPRKWK